MRQGADEGRSRETVSWVSMNAAYTSRGRRDEVAASSRTELEEVVVSTPERRNNMALWLLFSVPPLLGRNRTVILIVKSV